MSISSKSPRKVAYAAWEVAKESLPAYPHKFAPKKFTQHQLFACLVLMRLFKTDYRGVEACLHDMPSICKTIGLKKVPHFTTLHQAEKRLLRLPNVRKLLDSSVSLEMDRRHVVALAAADSTGMDATRASRYFVRRRSREPNLWQTTTYKRFPKMSLIVDCRSHLILSLVTGRGPRPDVDELPEMLDELVPHATVRHCVSDAGYDSEWNHTYARDYHGILTTIPARHGRPTDKAPSGYYRRLMNRTIEHRAYYGQRWQIETVNSMIKRMLGSALRSRRTRSQNQEIKLRAITHNVMILRPMVF